MRIALPQSVDEMTDILDIEGLAVSPWPGIARNLLWAVVILACAALVYFLIRYLRQRWRSSGSALPPFDEAMRRLKNLKTEPFLASGDSASLYFELTEILKRYVTDELKIDILDRTTNEIRTLKKDFSPHLKSEDWAVLLDFLGRSDFVKFARTAVNAEQAAADTKLVEALIRKCHASGALSGRKGASV